MHDFPTNEYMKFVELKEFSDGTFLCVYSTRFYLPGYCRDVLAQEKLSIIENDLAVQYTEEGDVICYKGEVAKRRCSILSMLEFLFEDLTVQIPCTLKDDTSQARINIEFSQYHNEIKIVSLNKESIIKAAEMLFSILPAYINKYH